MPFKMSEAKRNLTVLTLFLATTTNKSIKNKKIKRQFTIGILQVRLTKRIDIITMIIMY